MADHLLPTKTPAKFFDYIGLGLLLAPPEVIVQDLLHKTAISPDEWQRSGLFILAGFIALAAGTWLENMKPGSGGERLATRFEAIANNPIAWLIAATLIVFGVPTALGRTSTTTFEFLIAFIVMITLMWALFVRRSGHPRAATGIAITSPLDGAILTNGKPRKYGGRDFAVSGTYEGDIPSGHAIWIVNEDRFTKDVWPQRPRVKWGDGKWEGGSFLSKGQTEVTIVALVAPPGVSDFFEYYFKAMRSTKKEMADGKYDNIVVAVNRLPPDCKIVARVNVRRTDND